VNLDGKYLLRTSDPGLSAEDIALGYKQLLEVERGWRDLKQVIDLRGFAPFPVAPSMASAPSQPVRAGVAEPVLAGPPGRYPAALSAAAAHPDAPSISMSSRGSV
jgi:hypothetical protein